MILRWAILRIIMMILKMTLTMNTLLALCVSKTYLGRRPINHWISWHQQWWTMEMMVIIITIISIQMENHRDDDAENTTELQNDIIIKWWWWYHCWIEQAGARPRESRQIISASVWTFAHTTGQPCWWWQWWSWWSWQLWSRWWHLLTAGQSCQ